MEFYDIWNQVETILKTLDGLEICDDDFHMQLERFKSNFKNARKINCMSYVDDSENIESHEAATKYNINEKYDDEILDDNIRLLQELINRQIRYRKSIEKVWKELERHYIDKIFNPVTFVSTAGEEYKIESMENEPNIWEEIKNKLIHYKSKIENLWNELALLVICGPKVYFTKSTYTNS